MSKVQKWLDSQRAYYDKEAKRVYYLSLEFLMGRLLGNNVINLQLEEQCQKALSVLGLDQAVGDADLSAAVDAALASMPDKVASYRAGKTSLLGLFTGQVMKATGGKADPKSVQDALRRKLE